MELEINGSLWINSVKYEYVDSIIIDKDDVEWGERLFNRKISVNK